MTDFREEGIRALQTIISEKNSGVVDEFLYRRSGDDARLYKWYLYQTVGHILEDTRKLKEIVKGLKKGKIGWKAPEYDTVASKLQEHDEYIVKPFDVVDGVVTCPKCSSSKTWSIQKQLRSGDEGMTTLSRCVECGNHWSVNA
jgi:DNA-directed RNA polymerase subunit M/transcription elongation factor TFIIS